MKFYVNPARLEQFIDQFCHRVPGASIAFSEFAARFRAWCPLSERHHWTNYRLSRALREAGVEVGSRTGNVVFIGNLAWTPGLPSGEFIAVPRRNGRRLIRV
jgi:hypothetical protein